MDINTVCPGRKKREMPGLVDVEHVSTVMIRTRFRQIDRSIGGRIIPHIPFIRFAADLYVTAKLETEHLVSPSARIVVHHFVRCHKIPVAADPAAARYPDIVDPFAEEHGVLEESMSHVLFGQVILRIPVGTDVRR